MINTQCVIITLFRGAPDRMSFKSCDLLKGLTDIHWTLTV